MTALTVPSGRDEALRPVPWHRMAWVTWRQHRAALAGAAALVAVAGVYVLLQGLQLHHAYAPVGACRPASSPACQNAASSFGQQYGFGTGVTAALLQALPALVGAFAGAPVLARELETGTFRYAWTQGFGRRRWAIAKLVPLAATVTALGAAFGLLYAWAYQPMLDTPYTDSPLQPTVFDLHPVPLAAWTLVSFAIGALAGMAIRRVVPALGASLAVWAGLAFAAGSFLRRHYAAPLVTAQPNLASSAWTLSQGWARGGHPVSLAQVNQALRPVNVRAITPTGFQAYGPGLKGLNPVQYLIRHGFTPSTTYQPAGRLWPFEWIETGWLLAVALLLLAATVWLVRRRAA